MLLRIWGVLPQRLECVVKSLKEEIDVLVESPKDKVLPFCLPGIRGLKQPSRCWIKLFVLLPALPSDEQGHTANETIRSQSRGLTTVSMLDQ